MSRLLTVLALLLATAAVPAQELDIQRWRTAAGTEVLFVPRDELPIVDLRVVFDAGSARDGAQPGLARLVSNLLLEGTGALSAGEIARRFERYGARVSTDSGRDTASVSLRALSDPERLDPVVAHLAEVLAGARFPADALERARQRMLVGLRQAQASPSAVAERAFAEAIYGDHPYASPPEGTAASVRTLDRERVRAFHRRYYAAANATIAIVGDLDRAAAEAMAARLSAALPAGERAEPLPQVSLPQAARTVRIPFDSAQTHVIMGHPSVARGDEAYYPLYLANHVLGGGGLVSMLAERLREQRGLSYSSASSLTAGARRGRFEMSTQVRNEALTEALAVMRDTLAELREEGPDPERLEAARRNITGSFPLQLDSNRDLLGYVATIGFHDLPEDYLGRFVRRIEVLEAETVVAALREHIHPERMVTVLVGPQDVIEAVDR